MPRRAYRDAVGIDYTVRELFVALVGFIQGDDSVDAPFIKELVSGVVVAGAVRDESVHCEVGVEVPELGEGDNGGNAVVTFSVNQPQVQWQVQFLRTIVRRNKVPGIAIEVSLIVAIPSAPCSRTTCVEMRNKTGQAINSLNSASELAGEVPA